MAEGTRARLPDRIRPDRTNSVLDGDRRLLPKGGFPAQHAVGELESMECRTLGIRVGNSLQGNRKFGDGRAPHNSSRNAAAALALEFSVDFVLLGVRYYPAFRDGSLRVCAAPVQISTPDSERASHLTNVSGGVIAGRLLRDPRLSGATISLDRTQHHARFGCDLPGRDFD